MSAVQRIEVKTIDGRAATLADYAGSVVLVVNVASKCGLTPQYEGLEQLYRKYRSRGFLVLGFPANDFLAQEPGTEAEIAEFCALNYQIDFPMFAKIRVAGPDRHPLYSALIAAQPHATSTNDGLLRRQLVEHDIPANRDPEILWNFEKFLVSRDGQVVARFAPDTEPSDPLLVAIIERQLKVAALTPT